MSATIGHAATSVARDGDAVAFGDLTIAVDDRILRPRPWTVLQSLWAAELLAEAPQGRVLELFAGAGHIGLMAVSIEPRDLVLVDVDPVACEFARINAEQVGAARVEVRCAKINEALQPDEEFTLMIADPPWVPTARTHQFPDDPLLAIDGGGDGLDLARSSLEVMAAHRIGVCVLQLGSKQQAADITSYVVAHPGLGLAVVEVREEPGCGVLVHLRRTASEGSSR